MTNAHDSALDRPCYRLTGAIPCAGMLSFADGRLRFEPRGMLSALFAGEAVNLALADIDEVRIAGLDRHLTVLSGGQTLRFTGRGARALHGPLASALASMGQEADNVVSLFGAPDHVVLRGRARLYLNRVMAVGGEVALSPRSLRFEPTSRLEVWAWGTPALDVPLCDIESIRMSGARQLLTISVGRRTVTLGGALIPSLVGALRILRGGPFKERVPPGERELVVDVFSGRLRTSGDLRSRSGTITVGTHRLVFVCAPGQAAREPVDIPLADVDRLALPGGRSGRILVRSGGRELALHCAHASVRFRELSRLLVGVRHPGEPAVLRNGAIDSEDFAAAISAWVAAGRLRSAPERVLHAGPAVEWVDAVSARRGLLGLTTARALFLPSAGPAGDERPVEATWALEPPDEPGDRTLSLGEAAAGPFVPRGGRLFVETFWERWRATSEVADRSPRLRTGQPIEAVLGMCAYVQILEGKMPLVTLSNTTLEEVEGGVGLVFEGTPDRVLDQGALVQFEVGRASGLFRFGGRVRSFEPVARGASERPAVLIAICALTDISHVENRSGYRAKASDPVDVHRLLQSQKRGTVRADAIYDCVLDDLSMVGCSLLAPERIEVGSLLAVELPLTSTVLSVQAEVVRTREQWGRRRFQHGLRFIGLSAGGRDLIHVDILRRQREEAARRAEGWQG